MNFSLKIKELIVILIFLIDISFQFSQKDEAEYIASFQTLIKNSYSAELPSGIKSSCVDKGSASANSPTVLIDKSMNSYDVQLKCGSNSICTIQSGVVITMTSSLNLAALVIRGTFNWNDQTQSSNDQWICAGYIAVGGGEFNMNLVSKKGYIYIKNNNLKHDKLSYRALGSYDKGKITIIGRSLPRTWSLLGKKIGRPVTSISLMHDPVEMGWQIGDRIVIGPNNFYEIGSVGTAEDFFIGGFGSNNTVHLTNKYGQKASTSKVYFAETRYLNKETFATASAEVINLSRNILITGDDFTHVQGQVHSNSLSVDDFDKEQSDHCAAYPKVNRKQCTLGLHVMARDPGAKLSLQYVRIEKCGQRGVLGKYCVHLHLVQSCPECKIIGNAFEYGHQRGTVVHGTHLATIEINVYNDIRGTNIYMEDGNEMYNQILYNVGICPWPLYGEKRGCTIPGTDNDQSDTILNQSGFWALGFQNYAIGNRFSNHFNGMLYQEQGFADGRQLIKGKMCNDKQKIGRMEGNTFHHHGRFGTYVLADIFPKNVERTVESDGIPVNKIRDCTAWLPDGSDNGSPAMIKNNVDYINAFVGQYNAGDLQYKNHISFKNQNNIYWKETKNFQDGCSSHLLDSYYENGNMALPGGHGTFIFENVLFKDHVSFESSHHCNSGQTGVLCMPTYLFVNMTWKGNKQEAIVKWHEGDGRDSNYGAMFTLGPDDSLNGNALFPPGYRSIIHPYWDYLLELDNKLTCFRESQVNEPKSKYQFKMTPYGAILCIKPVRRLEIFSYGNDRRNMVLELYQNERQISKIIIKFYEIPGTNKKGYSAVVIPGLTHKYKLRMESGDPNVPANWIIEFSDPVFGNRWQKDEIYLEVAGRNCPAITSSQHDRRWIWSGTDHLYKPGRGACSGNPDMNTIICRNQPKLTNIEQCSKCNGKSCNNGYCDCGSGQCMCEPGFSGSNCQTNVCSTANCVNGVCSARYLGGEVPVTLNRCVCQDGWYGERCDSRIEPTPDVTSLLPCDSFCKGEFPYGCNTALQYGYCSASGNCHYGLTNDANLCCFIGCESTTVNPVNPPVNPVSTTKKPNPINPNPTTNCNGKCQGSYPYGCNSGFNVGYCNPTGGCYYEPTSDSSWCCFKGCSTLNPITVTQRPVTSASTTKSNSGSLICDGRCNGSYPYGCNPSFDIAYCNPTGGCDYKHNNDPSMCCFKGC